MTLQKNNRYRIYDCAQRVNVNVTVWVRFLIGGISCTNFVAPVRRQRGVNSRHAHCLNDIENGVS